MRCGMPVLRGGLRDHGGYEPGELHDDGGLHGLLPANFLHGGVRAGRGDLRGDCDRMNTEALSRRREALLTLLRDDDPATVALVKAQLAAGGTGMLPELRAMEEMADPVAAFHLQDVIAEIEEQTAESTFMEMCKSFGEHGDLEAAAWQLAMVLQPGEDLTEAREQLDAWGAEVRRRITKAQTAL